LGQLLGYEPSIVSRVKDRLRQTEHFNALPTSWRLSSVNPGKPAASFICDVPVSNLSRNATAPCYVAPTHGHTTMQAASNDKVVLYVN